MYTIGPISELFNFHTQFRLPLYQSYVGPAATLEIACTEYHHNPSQGAEAGYKQLGMMDHNSHRCLPLHHLRMKLY